MLTTKPKFRSNGLIGKYLNHTASDIHHIGGSSECSVQGQMGRWISGHTNASFNGGREITPRDKLSDEILFLTSCILPWLPDRNISLSLTHCNLVPIRGSYDCSSCSHHGKIYHSKETNLSDIISLGETLEDDILDEEWHLYASCEKCWLDPNKRHLLPILPEYTPIVWQQDLEKLEIGENDYTLEDLQALKQEIIATLNYWQNTCVKNRISLHVKAYNSAAEEKVKSFVSTHQLTLK